MRRTFALEKRKAPLKRALFFYAFKRYSAAQHGHTVRGEGMRTMIVCGSPEVVSSMLNVGVDLLTRTLSPVHNRKDARRAIQEFLDTLENGADEQSVAVRLMTAKVVVDGCGDSCMPLDVLLKRLRDVHVRMRVGRVMM